MDHYSLIDARMSKKWITIVLLTLILTLPGSVFSEGPGKSGYVPGEILVKFRSGVSRSSRNTAHSSHGFRLLKRFKRFQIDHVKIPDGWTVEEAVAAYRNLPLPPRVGTAQHRTIRWNARCGHRLPRGVGYADRGPECGCCRGGLRCRP